MSLSVTSNSSVSEQRMTPGSSVLMEKLTPSLANLWTAWSSNVAELVQILDDGHTCVWCGRKAYIFQLNRVQSVGLSKYNIIISSE